MKSKFFRFIFRVISMTLCICMPLGAATNAATMPPKHSDFESLTAQTYKTVYDIAPSKGVDGFGEKDRVGMKFTREDKWVYLDTYEFRAGSEKLGIYVPTVKETPTFRAYGIDVASGKEINLLPTEVSQNLQYNYAGDGDTSLNANKFKSTYMEYQKDDIFIASPSKTSKFVIAFNAPADGSYDFTETVLKRTSMNGTPKKYSGVTYSVVKGSEVIASVTNERTETNLTDEQKYTLKGSVDLKKGEDLFFIMEVAAENEADRGFTTRLKTLKLVCNSRAYTLDKYPGNEGVVTARGYSEGDDLYFWYETSQEKDPDQKTSDAFGMRAVKKNAVLTFVAPRSGTFLITAKLQRATAGTSTVKVTKNGATVKSFEVTENLTEITHSVVLDQDETVDLELVYDGSGDKVYARSLSTAIKALHTGELDLEYNNEGQTPLYSVAFMSDLHLEGEIIGTEKPIKQNVVNAIEYLKAKGGVDAILLGGDNLGEAIYHTNNMQKSPWNYENIISTITYLDNSLAAATKTGKNIFYVSGNHDKQPGVIAEWKDPNVRIHSGSYTHWMLARSGGYYDALYMKDITGDASKCRYPDEVLCYRYNVGGLDFIGINQSYTGNANPLSEDRGAGQQMYPQQIIWLREQLEEIGSDKTVMITCHYNFSTDGENYEFRAPGKYADLGDPRTMLMELLEEYPNVIYTYGHIHWRTEEETAFYNSSELIWNFGDKTQNDDGSYTTTGYHYIHGSSISNSATRLDQSGPYGGDTNISQIMTLDFYRDHITIEIVNVGKLENVEGVRKMTTYTIKRDMSQLDVYSGKETSPETSQFETMSSPGETTAPPDTTKPSRPTRPVVTYEPEKKDGGERKIDPFAIIIPVVGAVVGAATVLAVTMIKRNKKKK